MEMTILGCSGSLPGSDNAASGYLLRMSDGERILMDIGSGVLARLEAHDAPSDVHMVFSHLHPDHCTDFPSLLVWQRYHPVNGAQRRHTLLGPSTSRVHLGRMGADTLDTLDDFSDIFDVVTWSAPGEEPVVFPDPAYTEHRIGTSCLYAAPAVHPIESYLIRVEDADGSSLVYSGDTAATDRLAALATGADVLLCEATWGERSGGNLPPQMHLSGEEAGQAAAMAGVGRLVLTHIPPWGDPEGAVRGARRFFDGPVDLAVPDMVVTPGR